MTLYTLNLHMLYVNNISKLEQTPKKGKSNKCWTDWKQWLQGEGHVVPI